MKNYKISEEFIFNNIFFLFLIFQATTLKYNLGIESVSFIFNGILYLLPISILIFKLPQSSINRYEALIFTLLFFTIFISYVNLFLQGISYVAFVQTMTFTYPWLVFLTVIVSREYILNNIAKYWSWFNSFIVILTFLGLIEYIALFCF